MDMDNESLNFNDNDKDKEIRINKNHIGFRTTSTTLNIEAYAMPSNTYVEDDSHCFVVTRDRINCWANYGRCWDSEGDRTKVADQKAYSEWLMEFCPPNDYGKCGIFFGLNGVCHTTANRELLIGEDDVDVRLAPKNFVTVSIFGKYGFGLKVLKTLITDAYNKVTLTIDIPKETLDKVLARIDNTLEDETSAWIQLITEYLGISLADIINSHSDALDKLQAMIQTLLTNRENLYEQFLNKVLNTFSFKNSMHELITSNLNNYVLFLETSGYISSSLKDSALESARKFFNRLFGIIDGQQQAIVDSGHLDPDLAKK